MGEPLKLQSAVGLSRPCASARWFAFTGVPHQMSPESFSPALTSLSTTTAGPHPDCRCNGASLEWLLLTVVCRCGVVFERWVTSVDADDDLISWTRLEAIRN